MLLLSGLLACDDHPTVPAPSEPPGDCGVPVLGSAVPVDPLYAHDVGAWLRTFAVGQDAALVVYEVPADPALSDSGTDGATCWARVLSADGSPQSEPIEVECDPMWVVALDDGFFLFTQGSAWRVGEDGALTPLGAPLGAVFAAVDHGAGVRTFTIEQAGADWNLVRRDLADDGTADEQIVGTFAHTGIRPGFAVAHDGVHGALVAYDYDWQSTGASWIRLDADGAFVGDWAVLDVPGGEISLLADGGVFRGVHCTLSSPDFCAAFELTGATSAVGPPLQLEEAQYVVPRAGGASLLGADLSAATAFEVPLATDLAPGDPELLPFPFWVGWPAEGGAGLLAVGVDERANLLVGTLDAPPVTVAASVRTPYRQEMASAVAGAAGTWLLWSEDGGAERSWVGVRLDPEGRPIGGPVALAAASVAVEWAGIVTDDAVWAWADGELWSFDPGLGSHEVLAAGPTYAGPGAWVDDRGLVPVGGSVRALDASGAVVAEVAVDPYASAVAIFPGAPVPGGAELGLLATVGPIDDDTYGVALRTVDRDLNLSEPAFWPDAFWVYDGAPCGPGCWTASLSANPETVVRITADGTSAPTVEPWWYGFAPLVHGACGVLVGSDPLAWAPDFASAPIPFDVALEGTVVGVLSTGDRSQVVVEAADGDVYTRSVSW